MDINQAVIIGTCTRLEHSHNHNGREYYKATITTKRKSGTEDEIQVILPDYMNTLKAGTKAMISGAIRSRRANGKLINYIYADHVEPRNQDDENETIVEGYVCSQPYRKQTRKRELTQFLVCIDETRPSHISVLVWKRNDIQIGDKLIIQGRMQSRQINVAGIEKMINEISAYRAEAAPTNTPTKLAI